MVQQESQNSFFAIYRSIGSDDDDCLSNDSYVIMIIMAMNSFQVNIFSVSFHK